MKSRVTKSYLIGVDLGGTNVRAGLVSDGKLLKVDARPIRSLGSKKEVFDDVCASIEAVFDERVTGLGVGVPSLVSPEDGVIFDTTNIPSWTRVPLRKLLEKRFGVAVRVNNDANCFALGERYFGAASDFENSVGLIIGTGLGAGLISRGHLHSGVSCGAGEYGTIPYRDSILEHYASGQFFSRQGFEGAEVARLAAAGDAHALRLFDEYGVHFAFAVKLILYSFAPEAIVLGGSVSKSLKFFKPSTQKALEDFAYPSLVKNLKFKVSTVKYGAILGAASLLND